MTFRILAVFLMLATPVRAQPERPYDNSDPEMRALLTTFFQTVPCGETVTGLCEDAIALLRGGGDRMAAYLIRQPEPEIPNAYRISKWTYIRLIGHTESETAYGFLSLMVAEEATAFEKDPARDMLPLMFALEGLANTRDKRALPVAFDIVDRFSNPEVRYRAVRAMDAVQAKHGPQPGVAAKLRAIQSGPQRAAAEPGAGESEMILDRYVERVLKTPGATRP